jgi:hypothetical protein
MHTTNDLESAVFHAVYNSFEQRRLRLMAIILLGLKHGLRGIVFSWPLYFIALLPFLLPDEAGWWIVLFVFPALAVSGYILLKGVREDYMELIVGQILKANKLINILWWS